VYSIGTADIMAGTKPLMGVARPDPPGVDPPAMDEGPAEEEAISLPPLLPLLLYW